MVGVLIGVVGLAGYFLLNGVTYLAVIVGYGMLRLPKHVKQDAQAPFFEAIREAFCYSVGNGPLRAIMNLVSIMGFYSLCFLGLGSVGSLATGWLAKAFGAPGAVIIGAVVCMRGGLLVRRRIIPISAD